MLGVGDEKCWALREVDFFGLLSDVEGKAVEAGLQVELDALVGILCSHVLWR